MSADVPVARKDGEMTNFLRSKIAAILVLLVLPNVTSSQETKTPRELSLVLLGKISPEVSLYQDRMVESGGRCSAPEDPVRSESRSP